jgi:hypothetical protein
MPGDRDLLAAFDAAEQLWQRGSGLGNGHGSHSRIVHHCTSKYGVLLHPCPAHPHDAKRTEPRRSVVARASAIAQSDSGSSAWCAGGCPQPEGFGSDEEIVPRWPAPRSATTSARNGHFRLLIGAALAVRTRHWIPLLVTAKRLTSDPYEQSRSGSALCSPLLGGARLCSSLLDSDLGLRDEPQVGEWW